MAEPIGLGLAVAQVCGLAGGIGQLADALWQLSKDENIGGDIEASISRLKTTTNTIKCAIKSLKASAKKYPESKAIRYLTRKKIIRGIGVDADNLRQKMQDIATEIAAMKFLRKFKWIWFMREKLNGLIPMVTHLHSMIKSATTSVLLEVMESVASQPKGQSHQVDENLLNVMKDSIRRALREELSQHRAEIRHQEEYELGPAQIALFGSTQALSTEELIKPMLKLVDTLQETGHVPVSQSSRSSRRSRSTTQSRQRSGRSNPSTQPSTPQTIADLPSPPRTVSGTESSVRTILTEPQGSEPKQDPMSSQSSLGHMDIVDMNVIERPTYYETESRYVISSSPVSETIKPPTESEGGPASLTLSDRTHRPAITGHISAQQQQQSRISVIARLDKSIGVNLISLAQVRNLRLDHGSANGSLKTVMLESQGFMSVIGRTEAYWWKEDKGIPKPVRLSFHICGRLDEGIILGRQALRS
ncbi:hypothetical protein CC79DRAFT_478054 [Sarocladium strictum]